MKKWPYSRTAWEQVTRLDDLMPWSSCRQRRLFALALARSVLPIIGCELCLNAVETAEMHLDGIETLSRVRRARVGVTHIKLSDFALYVQAVRQGWTLHHGVCTIPVTTNGCQEDFLHIKSLKET